MKKDKEQIISEKSKKYRRWRPPNSKQLFNTGEACKFMGITADQLSEMVLGKKNYPQLQYIYDRESHSIKFDRKILTNYRYHWDMSKRNMADWRLKTNRP